MNKKLCVNCEHCNLKFNTRQCKRSDSKTGLSIDRSVNSERTFSIFNNNCGIRGKYFKAKYPIPDIDYTRLRELCKFLYEKIYAYGYHTGLGFQNALGDFEINESLWDEYVNEINEFEDIVVNYKEMSKCDIIIINMKDAAITRYIKA